MAKRFRDRSSWAYGSAPAQGSTPHPQPCDDMCSSAFIGGIMSASDDPIKQYEVPSLAGSTIRNDVNPGVWGNASKCP